MVVVQQTLTNTNTSLTHSQTSNDVDVKRVAPTKQAPPPPPAVHSTSKAKPKPKTKKKQQVQGDPDPRLAAAVASFVKNGVDAFKARQLRVARDAWEAAVALYPACVDALIGLGKTRACARCSPKCQPHAVLGEPHCSQGGYEHR